MTPKTSGQVAPPPATGMIIALPSTPDISITARAVVRGFAVQLGARRTADACLLVSELVTNAYLHGRGHIRLTIALRDDVARFAVRDDGDAALGPSPDPGEHGGWGLNIVACVADRWGSDTAPTHVWFELRTPSSRRPAATAPNAVVVITRADTPPGIETVQPPPLLDGHEHEATG